MVTTVRMDGCADPSHEHKKPDLIIENTK